MPNQLEQKLAELNANKSRAQVAAYNALHHTRNQDMINKRNETDAILNKSLEELAAMGYIVGQNLVYDHNDNIYRLATQTSFL